MNLTDKKLWTGIGVGAGLGALAMFLTDPRAGRRRRALVSDKVGKSWNTTHRAVTGTTRDVANRVYGVYAGAKSMVTREEVSDEKLVDRVRAQLGHHVSNPGALTVTSYGGRIVLSGPILEKEVGPLVSAVSSIKGVRTVDNALDVHLSPDSPSLQGARTH